MCPLPFIETKPSDDDAKSVYALDTQMCYTELGLEVTRICLVDWSENVVMNVFVKPSNLIINHNTTFRGILPLHLTNCKRHLNDIRPHLMKYINRSTILIGHSLERLTSSGYLP